MCPAQFGGLLGIACFSAYLVVATACASQPLLALQAIRYAWLCLTLMAAIATRAVFFVQRAKRNSGPINHHEAARA